MTIPLSLRFDILNRDGFRCRYCGRNAPETELEVDHVHARSKGGSDGADNLVTTCRDCNRGKSDKPVVPAGGPNWGSLVGRFFHTFDVREGRKEIAKQGVVIGDLGHGYLMVDHFEWISGGRGFYGRKVVHVSAISREGWAFYTDADEMQEAYEYGGLKAR
jgi:hypothetical protein